jgi:hypothetical protein
MRKTILFFLLFAGTGNALHAQFDLPDPVEWTFNTPKTSKSNVVFTFFLSSHTRVMLDMSFISQAANLPDLDSMLQVAVKLLAPLQDSLRSDGVVRRVDINMRNDLSKIRILTHPELSNSYTIKDDELLQLKVNQDTVRLIGYAESMLKYTRIVDGVSTKSPLGGTFVVTIITDNVGDIAKIGPGQLKKCLDVLRPKIQKYTRVNHYNINATNYRASFNMSLGGQMVTPTNMSVVYSGETQFSLSFAPTFGFARGSFVTAVRTGIDYNFSRGYYNRTKLRLLSEIEAYFPIDPVSKRVNIELNRFIGLQLLQYIRPLSDKLELAANLSLTYLLTKNSALYENHTFRFGMPILTSKHLTIEPLLIFNGKLRNPSPSVRISFDLFSVTR